MWPVNDREELMRLHALLLGDPLTLLIQVWERIFLISIYPLGCTWSKSSSNNIFDSELFCFPTYSENHHRLQQPPVGFLSLAFSHHSFVLDEISVLFGSGCSNVHNIFNILCVFHLNPTSVLKLAAIPLGPWTSWWLCQTAHWSGSPNYSILCM